MKIHLKDNKITLYDIESDYRQYLFQYDFRVNLKPNRRLYIFHTINFKAFMKNGKRRNPRTTVEIYNKSHEIIAALLINNMIPQGVYKRIDINNEYIYI